MEHDSTPREPPVINGAWTGSPQRYACALGLEGDDPTAPQGFLMKQDLRQGRRQRHDSSEGRSASEDGGWLTGFVIVSDGRGTALEMLDARELAKAPVVSVRLPPRIPPGLHGARSPDPA